MLNTTTKQKPQHCVICNKDYERVKGIHICAVKDRAPKTDKEMSKPR